MEYFELRGWINYFERRPVGWREDLRTSLIMEASGAKINRNKIFPSLAALHGADAKDSTNLKNSEMFKRLLGAKGGDNLLKLVGES
jgi:hypothetical protein